MSSNAAAPTLVRYVVYMPHGPRSMPFPFNIPEDAEVSDLAEAIAQHRNFKPYLERTQLILFKVLLLHLPLEIEPVT